MKLTIRILMIPIVAALAFLMILTMSRQGSATNAALLQSIERDYVPSINLRRDIAAGINEIRQGLRDAVAAEEPEDLLVTDAVKDALIKLIDESSTITTRSWRLGAHGRGLSSADFTC